MNHCRDCNSDYATPGTCNCFAPGGKRSTSPTYYVPTYYVPWVYSPYVPYVTPSWNPPYTITTLPQTTGTGITYFISGNTLRAEDVRAAASYTTVENRT